MAIYEERVPRIEAVKVPKRELMDSPFRDWDEYPTWLSVAVTSGRIIAVYDQSDNAWAFLVKIRSGDHLANAGGYIVKTETDGLQVLHEERFNAMFKKVGEN